MTYLVAWYFVAHRASCTLTVYCDSCEDDWPKVKALAFDIIGLIVAALTWKFTHSP